MVVSNNASNRCRRFRESHYTSSQRSVVSTVAPSSSSSLVETYCSERDKNSSTICHNSTSLFSRVVQTRFGWTCSLLWIPAVTAAASNGYVDTTTSMSTAFVGGGGRGSLPCSSWSSPLVPFCKKYSGQLGYGFQHRTVQRRTMSRMSSSSEIPSPVDTDNQEQEHKEEFASSYATSYHAPVMARECVEAMLQSARTKKSSNDNDGDDRPPLIFVDATLGGGGHSMALLEQMKPGDILLGCDVDSDALSAASERLKQYLASEEIKMSSSFPTHPIFVPVQSNFRNLHNVIPKLMHPYYPDTKLIRDNNNAEDDNTTHTTSDTVDAILMDLGVSSFQIDNAHRGFAFKKDGPLDMRMHTTTTTAHTSNSLTAADICNEFSEQDLLRILRQYGDEPRSRAIARSIVENRPLHSTSDLVHVVSLVTPQFASKKKGGRRMGRTATLARVFQSLRIVVNEEDAALKEALEHMTESLVQREGGRLVVLSYHSMEDRMVKRVLRDGTVDKKRTGPAAAEQRDMYGNYIGEAKPWKMLGKGKKATPEEVDANSRARSATLRIGERLRSI